MNSIFEVVKSWIGNIFQTKYRTVFVEEDTPPVMKKKVLYVVTEEGKPWHAAMLCPCGCGKTLNLNLIPDEHPVWRLVIHKKALGTLHPSIVCKDGCRSHFWLRDGRIFWCENLL